MSVVDNDLVLAMVCNRKYLDKFKETCRELRMVGQYAGKLVLVVGNDLRDYKDDFLLKYEVTVKWFPDFEMSPEFLQHMQDLKREPMWKEKLFQYHKFHLFDQYFTQWRYVLYIDCGIRVFSSLAPLLDLRPHRVLLAHSDAYPSYVWTLRCQFDQSHPMFDKLQKNYNLDVNYPQTTVMFYDTSVLSKINPGVLWNLAQEYPCSRTNDQGIAALYLTSNNLWRQLPLSDGKQMFYDYLARGKQPYMMLKMC